MGFISYAAFPGVKAGEGRTQNPLELPLLKKKKLYKAYRQNLNSESKLYFWDVPSEISSALN